MTAKDKAIRDMEKEFGKSNTCLMAFRTELNSKMRNIVRNYGGYYTRNPKAHSQLVARCTFLAPSEVRYDNYEQYYGKIQSR